MGFVEIAAVPPAVAIIPLTKLLGGGPAHVPLRRDPIL